MISVKKKSSLFLLTFQARLSSLWRKGSRLPLVDEFQDGLGCSSAHLHNVRTVSGQQVTLTWTWLPRRKNIRVLCCLRCLLFAWSGLLQLPRRPLDSIRIISNQGLGPGICTLDGGCSRPQRPRPDSRSYWDDSLGARLNFPWSRFWQV